jgi:hypothetical protein
MRVCMPVLLMLLLPSCAVIDDGLRSLGLTAPPELTLNAAVGRTSREFCLNQAGGSFGQLPDAARLRQAAQTAGASLPSDTAPALEIRLSAADNSAGYFALKERVTVTVQPKGNLVVLWALAQPVVVDGQRFLRFVAARPPQANAAASLSHTMPLAFDLALWIAPNGSVQDGCVDVMVERA